MLGGCVNEESNRPDPDALLRRVKADEARAREGKLKIFFGFAPGVGKTFRMLQAAHELAAQKIDVVVGLVETHRRPETQELIEGLDVLPRRRIEYRGHVLYDFDLDAALARKPKVLLVDELAHTNVAGARHPKRWQDILELLDAGIDVLTTVNVQHVESLVDVVAQATHVIVRETVPDSILDRADDIELVDIAPEVLLQRLKEGKVYLPDQAQRASQHFFQRGNLLALRELALRRTAQHVDEDVQEYREEHGVTETWQLGERILVAVGPSPTSERLIRATARMAAGLRCPWTAAYVESPSLGGLSEDERNRLETHLTLAETLGGTVTRLSGLRVSETLLSHARKTNVTRMVIGKPTHSRLLDRIVGSLLDEVVRGSGDIEVHVTSGLEGASLKRSKKNGGELDLDLEGYGYAALFVAVATGISWVMTSVFHVPDVEMFYLLTVMLIAMRLGRGPSMVGAALGVAAFDFFFVPPYFTMAVSDIRYLLTFAMMFGVGLVVSELTVRLKREQVDARAREERTKTLFALSRELGSAADTREIADIVSRHASETLSARAFLLARDSNRRLLVLASRPPGPELESKEIAVAEWVQEHGRGAGLGTDTLPGSATVSAPIRVGIETVGVIAIEPHRKKPLSSEQRDLLDALCRQAAFAMERMRLSAEARTAADRARTEELRSSLLSAVSHDLRTPLAAITGAATSLVDDSKLPPETQHELLLSICDEAERLERLVANLLDMTRLDAGDIRINREWVPLEELVSSALTRLEPKLGDRSVAVDIPTDLPLISVDPVLFEQVFVNLFENAAKYTPPHSPIEVKAKTKDQTVIVEVTDHGPGLPPGLEEKVFEKFFRGTHVGVSGVGLGLPICRGILTAHAGEIHAENRSEGGSLFRVSLPIVGHPPTVPTSEVE